MDNFDDDEKIPPLNLHSVVKWRQKLALLFNPFIGRKLESPTLDILAARIANKLRKKAKIIPEADLDKSDSVMRAVHRTLSDHALGEVIDKELIDTLRSLLAGNISALKCGLAIPNWVYQLKPEWVLAIIRDAYPYTTPHKQIHGYQLVLEILTGPATGKTLMQFYTDSSLSRLAIRIGAKLKADRRRLHPKDFVRLYMLTKIAEGDTIRSIRYKEKGSLAKRNAARSTARSKFKTLCPKQSKWPCAFCKWGYSSCACGTHPYDYSWNKCRHDHNGYIDPQHPNRQCTRCNYTQWLHKIGRISDYEKDQEEADSTQSSSTPDRHMDQGGGPTGRPEDVQSSGPVHSPVGPANETQGLHEIRT